MSGTSSRRGLWIALGSIFVIAGLVGAVVLWNAGTQRRASTIENFARAPIGCDTTLDFVEPGAYLLFVETTGTLDGVRGDCDVEGAYGDADSDADVEITLVDPDGAELDLNRSFGDVNYDAAGFRGVARFSVDIDDTDDHKLRAESDSGDAFVIAVGRDPSEGVAGLRVGAVAAGLLGLLVGLVFIMLGSRRSKATVPAGPWTPGSPVQPGVFVPGGPVPQGPPVYGQQGGPPAYQQPPVGQAPQPQYGQQAPQYGQPQPGQPAQYGQPGAFAQPQYAQPPQYGQQTPAPQPAPSTVPGEPNLPGHPAFPAAPADPAGSVQPIDWAPQKPAAPASSSETAPPDAEFLARLQEERSTQERPAPPPPE